MSEKRRPDRSTVVIAALVLVSIVAYVGLLAFSREYGASHQPGSSYDSTGLGLKVWYRYIEELGYDPQVLERFDELPPGATIIVSSPLWKTPTPQDASLVAEWVRSGGRLVLVGTDASRLASDLGVQGAAVLRQDRPMEPVLPSVYTNGVGEIDLDGERLEVADTAWVAHFKDLGGQGLLSRAIGSGEVVWLAGTYPVRNAGIGELDNAGLAVRLAVAGGSGEIYFDEYHHGYISGGGIWERLGHGGRAAVVLGLFAIVLLVLGPARRLGAPIAEPHVPVARTGAYTTSLGELYRRAGARREALETLEDGVKRVVAKRHGALLIGLERHPEAKAALELSASIRGRASIELAAFMEAAEALGRARREVEGRDV